MITRVLTTAAVIVAGSAALTAALPSAADAQSRSKIVGYVKTCSTYGNGCTSAPIRRGRNGYEFRLPGGTWIECRADCRNALREDSVDFWETQRERQRDW